MPLRRYKKELEGYAYLTPQLLGLVFWLGLPIIAALYLSFTRWDLIGKIEFVGLRNYINLLFHDHKMWRTLLNTFYFMVATVTLGTITSLIIAFLLYNLSIGKTLFKTVYFLPVVCSMAAMAALWRWLFNGDFGLVNQYIARLGVASPDWLTDTRFAMPAVIIMSIWKGLGLPMIIFLAGLHDIPKVYYESAEVDGAGKIRQFLHITIPLLSPVILFVLVTSIIACFQTFDQIYMMTGGGPMGATRTIVFYLYENAFIFHKFGNACAIAYILFVVLFIFTFLFMRFSKRWVYYQ